MNGRSKTGKKLAGGILIIVLLAMCLCFTSAALVYTAVTVDNNLFHTGTVEVDLNGGKPVIEEHEFLFEPGMTVKKRFYVRNNSSWDVYYRLYFDRVSGGLADVLEITVADADTDAVLYQGTASGLNREAVQAAESALTVGETRWFTITFHFPETAGNTAQNLTLTFDLCADAVQTKNNPDRVFD